MKNHRLGAMEAAKSFISKHYPECQGALLAGSVVRGEATVSSDLDIVIFDKNLPGPYRESLIEFGWPIEVFVHNLESYKQFFKSDCERARPSLPRMTAEGIILKDTGILHSIKEEAQELLAAGPEAWPAEIIKMKRYFITDALDDFIGCSDREEGLFIAGTLSGLASEFILRTNRKWTGTSKWTIRAMRQHDEDFARQFAYAFDSYYRTGSKEQVIGIVDEILHPFGGRLFEGFSLGKGAEGS
ncbi:nucleotidyltransferase domain-containing protein [Peribacillus sp. SCS-37]|uniref:nucleotidyltransferase domain-containing protein n=1 Tax=Paraperibacillus esterisolvens TaxID=3115296 RepID=UPI0039066D2D